MIYLQLFWVYIQIGLFGFGGGYAMLSLIQNEVVHKYHWLTNQQFTDIVAVSQVTPGPIGINSATYIGYVVTGGNILGSLLATTAVMLPSFVLCLIISRSFQAFRNNRYVDAAFLGIRPASVGLIAAAALMLMIQPGLWTLLTLPAGMPITVDNIIVTENFIDYRSFIIFAVTGLLLYKKWVHPILLIVLAGLAGALLYSL
ncbi:chromate transporter [Porphyromonas sp.]|uniref:chromate transporter n=1 Tax=Porphyromonas sp. TaxID=1924944 RepID=UPI00399233DB